MFALFRDQFTVEEVIKVKLLVSGKIWTISTGLSARSHATGLSFFRFSWKYTVT